MKTLKFTLLMLLFTSCSTGRFSGSGKLKKMRVERGETEPETQNVQAVLRSDNVESARVETEMNAPALSTDSLELVEVESEEMLAEKADKPSSEITPEKKKVRREKQNLWHLMSKKEYSTASSAFSAEKKQAFGSKSAMRANMSHFLQFLVCLAAAVLIVLGFMYIPVATAIILLVCAILACLFLVAYFVGSIFEAFLEIFNFI